MQELFGTDGIRGRANVYPMTPETALKTGRAVAAFFKKESGFKRESGDPAKIIIGKDTRISGDMLENALAAGICSMGMDVYLTGVLPTPGVAYLTAKMGFAAGIVISASHNPYFDNGIKLFNQDGFKLNDKQERKIENLIIDEKQDRNLPQDTEIGRIQSIFDAMDRYVGFLSSTIAAKDRLRRFSVVLDCANGATYQAAPKLFESVGLKVHTLFNSPDGININAECGSQHPEALAEEVITQKADIGLAFDGDGDRLIAVDETGSVLSGDQILTICAHHMKKKGLLTGNQVVSTVMSNMGFKQALAGLRIDHKATKVGDRHVMEKMRATGAVLGGEDSGHLIFLDHHSTGDGLLAALRLLSALSEDHRPLSKLSQLMTVFPQVLINVDVKDKPDLTTLPAVADAILKAKVRLGDKGRVLVRYSGTQPQCRVMVEGLEMETAQAECRKISEVIKNAIGA